MWYVTFSYEENKEKEVAVCLCSQMSSKGGFSSQKIQVAVNTDARFYLIVQPKKMFYITVTILIFLSVYSVTYLIYGMRHILQLNQL